MTDETKVLGLIAGQGRLPFIVAEGAKKEGLKVVCVGLADNAEEELTKIVGFFYTAPLARPGNWINKLRKHDVTLTIMVGRVTKTKMYTPFRILKYLPDWRAFRIWYWRLRNKDKQNDTVLKALADELASGGIILEDSTKYCKEHLANKGTMTKNQPSQSMLDDIEFGWSIVKKLGEFDIGQAAAVREKEIIAVEAIEGTAKMIERAGQCCKKGGWILIKASKPHQDMRFDVPCIGIDTIQQLKAANAKCVAVEAEKTIIIDKPDTLELADELGIIVVGM